MEIELFGMAASIWKSPEIRGVVAVSACVCASVILVYIALALRGLLLGSTDPAHPVDQLSPFQEMAESGTLSRFEYQRVRGAIAQQSKDESERAPKVQSKSLESALDSPLLIEQGSEPEFEDRHRSRQE